MMRAENTLLNHIGGTVMDLKLTDKIAIVTGTGSQIGFGKGIAGVLAG